MRRGQKLGDTKKAVAGTRMTVAAWVEPQPGGKWLEYF